MVEECSLLGPVGFGVQIMLGVLSFIILIYKRIREKPKRQWKVWGLDTSKQGCSQLVSHFLNVGLAVQLARGSSDQCGWYLSTLLLDTTCGVILCFTFLKIIETIFEQLKMANYQSGNYFLIIMPDDQVKKIEMNNKDKVPTNTHLLKPIIKIDLKAWLIQLLVWIFIVCLAKTILFFLQLTLASGLEAAQEAVLSPLSGADTLKLVLVMFIIPLIMNGIQFWVQDNFLKKTQFTVQEKKYVLSEMYVDEEMVHLAQLDHFVNQVTLTFINDQKGSQHSLDREPQVELPQILTNHNGYQKAELGD